MAKNFLARGERERERERAFHSRIPRQIRKRLFALMRADKILRIPERRSLVGCNAVVSLVLSPLGFRYVCVSRNYRRTVESNVNERCERMEFKRYTHNSVGFYLRENPHWSFHTFQIVSPYLLLFIRYSYLLIINRRLKLRRYTSTVIYQTIIPISSLLTYSYPVFHAFLPRIIKPGYNYRIITLSRRLPIILSILSPIISPFQHAFITFETGRNEQKESDERIENYPFSMYHYIIARKYRRMFA